MCIFDIGSKINSRAQNTIAHISVIFYMIFSHIHNMRTICIYLCRNLKFSREEPASLKIYIHDCQLNITFLIFLRIRVRGLRTYSHTYI